MEERSEHSDRCEESSGEISRKGGRTFRSLIMSAQDNEATAATPVPFPSSDLLIIPS